MESRSGADRDSFFTNKMKEKLSVSIQGYQGCFHQIAAEHYFGKENIRIDECKTFREVVQRVEKGESDYGIMAIENSIAGSILANYNLLQNPRLTISGEIFLHIRQHLLVNKGAAAQTIDSIKSHPMAIAQCMNYIDSLERNITLIESDDTALSARELSESGSLTQAVIASSRAAELYGLEIACEDIHTVKNNCTRFLIIEKSDKVILPESSDKASLYFKISNERGTLLRALKTFEHLNINMTKLQSYPIAEDLFRYLFHVDIHFEKLDDLRECMRELRQETEDFCICGIYKTGTMIK